MKNIFFVEKQLKKLGQYPIVNAKNEEDGLMISLKDNTLIISGNPDNLIELSDLLVSLALSGNQTGQHWHVDKISLVSEKSEISEMIITRNA